MNRRDFLKSVIAASAAPLWIRFGSLAAYAAEPAATPDHMLLVLYLAGGNDGLNTVVPYQDPAYLKARPTVGLGPNDVYPIGGGLGLHKSLTRVNQLWNSRPSQLAIVQNVGYANPNFSHFDSTFIWETASNEFRYHTGWLGRYLDATDAQARGPVRAVAAGFDALPRTLIGEKAGGVALGSLSDFSWLDDGRSDSALRRSAFAAFNDNVADGSMRSNIIQAQTQTTRAVSAVSGAARSTKGALTPAQTVANLFAAGIGLEIGFIQVGGFDTHTNEHGFQTAGLTNVDKAIGEFFDAATTLGIGDRVSVMTFTDFGRRVGENANAGTDHGSSGPLFVMGPQVRGGVYGARPDLSNSALSDGNLVPAIDMRSVYGSVLSGAFHIDPVPIMGGDFPLMPLIG